VAEWGVRVEGLTDLEDATDDLIERLAAAAMRIVVDLGALTEAGAKKNFVGSHAPGMPHVGGNRPNVVTGYLRRSIGMNVPIQIGSMWQTEVAPTAVYGRRVELGLDPTKSFPYLQPALVDVAVVAPALATSRWNAALS